MYAPIRLCTPGGSIIDGFVHDVAVGGVRFECDLELDAGSEIAFEIELPANAATIRGRGRILRLDDYDETTGTVIHAAVFERFDTRIDSATLTRYLEQGCLLRVA